MTNIEEILGLDEFKKVIKENNLLLADFYASWCAPCKMQTPILAEFQAETLGKVKVVKIDVDQNPELASKFSVQSIPSLLLFKNGELKQKTVGLTAKATLSEMLIKHI